MGLAVDIGTTKLAAYLVDLETGKAEGSITGDATSAEPAAGPDRHQRPERPERRPPERHLRHRRPDDIGA